MQPTALLQLPHAGDGSLLFIPPPAQCLHSANPAPQGKTERREESKGKAKFVGGRGIFRLCWNAASNWNLCTLPRSQVTDAITYTEGDSCSSWDEDMGSSLLLQWGHGTTVPTELLLLCTLQGLHVSTACKEPHTTAHMISLYTFLLYIFFQLKCHQSQGSQLQPEFCCKMGCGEMQWEDQTRLQKCKMLGGMGAAQIALTRSCLWCFLASLLWFGCKPAGIETDEAKNFHQSNESGASPAAVVWSQAGAESRCGTCSNDHGCSWQQEMGMQGRAEAVLSRQPKGMRRKAASASPALQHPGSSAPTAWFQSLEHGCRPGLVSRSSHASAPPLHIPTSPGHMNRKCSALWDVCQENIIKCKAKLAP